MWIVTLTKIPRQLQGFESLGGPSCEVVVEPTHLKNMIVKLDHLPNFRGENQKSLKPPPSIAFHFLKQKQNYRNFTGDPTHS